MKTYNYPPQVAFIDKVYGLLNNSNAIKVMAHQFRKLGNSYTIESSLAPNNFIFTKDPELIDYILRKGQKKYEKSYYQTEMLRKYVGRGLLTNYGIDWKRQRKLIQPGFNNAKIEALHDKMLEEIVAFVDEIPENKEQDFYPLFNHLAFRVVAKSLFSSHISDKQIQRISDVISKSQKLFTLETRNPVFSYLLSATGIIPRHLKNDVEEVREIFRNLIEQRRKSKPENDLLDLMMHVTYEDSGMPMEEEQLVDELLILFIAGHETTANALSFTFWLLGTNANIQEQLQEYLKSVEENEEDLKYLFKPSLVQNIIWESMRMYPPAWVTDRQALEDDEFEQYNWEKDTVIIGNIFEMNRMEHIWNDPLEFKPERFEDPNKLKDKKFIPFGSGPRYCIGEHFALMEMQLVLRYFFSKFSFETSQNDLKLLTYVTLRPKKIMGKKVSK